MTDDTDVAAGSAAPPLPTGLGAPDQRQPQRRPPILPIAPRLPGAPAPQQQGTPQTPTGQPPGNPNPNAPGTPANQPPAAPPPPAAPGAAATPGAPGGPAAPPPADASSDSEHSEDPDSDGGDAPDAAADPAHAAKSPFSPSDAIGMATGLAEPLLALPSTLMGLGTGLLAPFAQILQQFGQGTPAMPDSAGFPSDVLDRLGTIDPSTGMTGLPADAYQSDVDHQADQAHAMDNLERKLRTALQNSSSNSTMGRDKIEQIINQVKSTLQALGPIANTPMGQMGVLSAITQGLQQAGAVLTDALGKDTLNANTIKSMSADYIKDMNASGQGDQGSDHGGGVDGWIRGALAANGITDPRAVANWLPGMRTLVKRESGGNPRAFNGRDSNAAKGTPSQGLCQTIPPTFQAHWRPGTSRDIMDPVANTAAAIHYIMTRYHVSPHGMDLMSKVQQANPYAPPKGY